MRVHKGTNPNYFQKRGDVQLRQAEAAVSRLMKAGRSAHSAVMVATLEHGLSDEKTMRLHRYAATIEGEPS